jgi:hypothetical protein
MAEARVTSSMRMSMSTSVGTTVPRRSVLSRLLLVVSCSSA